MSDNWKTCKHEFEPVPRHSEFGVVYEDECIHCGSIGVLSDVPDENGMFYLVAQPQAEIFDLDAYRARKASSNGETGT